MFRGKNRNDQWEDTLLRAVILYNSISPRLKGNPLLTKAIYAIVAESAQNGASAENIKDLLQERFSLDFSTQEIENKLKALKSEKMLTVENDRYFASTASDEASAFYSTLSKETDEIIEHVVEKALSVGHLSVTVQDRFKMMENAKSALSTYFHHFGFAYIGLKKNAEENEIKDAVDVAKHNLSKPLADRLIGALFELISAPDDKHKTVLEKWARAFVTLELLNLDPAARNFKQTIIRDKTFVIDTDVALHCLTENTRYSKSFRQIVTTLSDAGCRIVIPNKVRSEIESHIVQAQVEYAKISAVIDELTEEVLSRENVFVEDYILRRRNVPDDRNLSFSKYISLFYNPNQPYLLTGRLKQIFGDNYVTWGETELTRIETPEENAILENLITVTENSSKGVTRQDVHNEDIARTDARIFCTIYKKNKSLSDSDSYRARTYFLTMSHKIKRTVKKVLADDNAAECLCHPAVVVSLFQEMEVKGKAGKIQANYLNLFDNPFLSYTSEKVWNEIEPLIRKNIELRYDDLMKLRLDAELNIHNNLLNTTDPNSVWEKASYLKKSGYEMGEAVVQALTKQRDYEAQIALLHQQLHDATTETTALRRQLSLPDRLRQLGIKNKRNKNMPYGKRKGKKRRK